MALDSHYRQRLQKQEDNALRFLRDNTVTHHGHGILLSDFKVLSYGTECVCIECNSVCEGRQVVIKLPISGGRILTRWDTSFKLRLRDHLIARKNKIKTNKIYICKINGHRLWIEDKLETFDLVSHKLIDRLSSAIPEAVLEARDIVETLKLHLGSYQFGKSAHGGVYLTDFRFHGVNHKCNCSPLSTLSSKLVVQHADLRLGYTV